MICNYVTYKMLDLINISIHACNEYCNRNIADTYQSTCDRDRLLDSTKFHRVHVDEDECSHSGVSN